MLLPVFDHPKTSLLLELCLILSHRQIIFDLIGHVLQIRKQFSNFILTPFGELRVKKYHFGEVGLTRNMSPFSGKKKNILLKITCNAYNRFMRKTQIHTWTVVWIRPFWPLCKWDVTTLTSNYFEHKVNTMEWYNL